MVSLKETGKTMTEREFYKVLEETTHNYDCEKCCYGIMEECNLQCNEKYEDYKKLVESYNIDFSTYGL